MHESIRNCKILHRTECKEPGLCDCACKQVAAWNSSRTPHKPAAAFGSETRRRQDGQERSGRVDGVATETVAQRGWRGDRWCQGCWDWAARRPAEQHHRFTPLSHISTAAPQPPLSFHQLFRQLRRRRRRPSGVPHMWRSGSAGRRQKWCPEWIGRRTTPSYSRRPSVRPFDSVSKQTG